MAGRERDYYSLLGIGRNASATDIERAFRRVARATHPDVHPDDSSATERFSAVAIAYETLSNPARRASYDRAQARLEAIDPAPVAHHTPAVDVAPVHLGRRPPGHPLRPFPAARVEPIATDLLGIVAMLTRLVGVRPLP
jgi:curved DNA-binding protein CbpA